MRYCVVGGGILGLAAGRLLATQQGEAEVLVLEKEQQLASHQTSHNSGVVHAGLYYEPGSLKARLCVQGVKLLRAYCAEQGVAYEECGKVLVASDEQERNRLARIEQRALANGVEGVQMLSEAELRELEPHVRAIAALHSRRTAIVDYAAVAACLAEEIKRSGGQVRLGTAAVAVEQGKRPCVRLRDGSSIEADYVIVCAGLQADRLASRSGEDQAPRILPFRGEYWALRKERDDLVKGLVYPVPDPRLPFLGVHFTKRLDGSVLVGPNAVLTLAREGYKRGAFEREQVLELLLYGGTWRLLARHWRSACGELARSSSKRLLAAHARRMLPALHAGDLLPAGAGVRAQAVDKDGALVDDFRLGGSSRVMWVRNAPSPAATASLAIAEVLVERLGDLSGGGSAAAHGGRPASC